MAQDYTEWLAINVLNDQQLISYRSLSRALKVHSNLAKQMLYDFHRKQNAKKPGAVHATYLITGTKLKNVAQTNGFHSQQDEENTVMQSSPPLPSSSAPQPDDDTKTEAVAVRTVMVAKEEHLSQAKAAFQSITGVHVYSLEVKGLSDIQSLTECNRKILVDYASEDPLEVWKQYGTIQNPNVMRRTQRRQPPPAATAAPAKTKPSASTVKPAALEKRVSKDSQDSKPSSKPTSAKATSEPSKKPSNVKRQGSDIFKSFAKSKTKLPRTDSQSSAAPSPKPVVEDEPMTGFSDEEGADSVDDEVVDAAADTVEGKSKAEREADLQAMMDQEDEPMEDVEEFKAEATDADAGAIDKPFSQPKEELKETVQVQDGRRRGRRRVMKKKTVKDEDGYLGKPQPKPTPYTVNKLGANEHIVTREEAAWESFSEDEPAPKKIKVAAVSSMQAQGQKKDKEKDGGGKGGQKGGIMSFFAKK
ncbi:hypothetical protein LTR62_000953 [Meristemomyces frigidus]|uniref:DNA polymerase delta subunit 3 n=1 Tax=Meristemomyces frigidus TaxID=1508187 RepID=A0AAN7TCD8_9PEZI|nr:hypothetical protein LTR62_000953 [Meristemomyces frigidus]